MSEKRVVIGVDGGGTHTRVAVVQEDGRFLGIGVAGPGNYHDVGVDAVSANIRQALSDAWAQAGEPQRAAAAAFLGLGSVVSQEDHETVRGLAAKAGLAPADRIGTGHDLRVALAGALAGEPGIVLIVGTGSSCYGRTADGRSWRAGGWGSLLDDLGSSVYLGVQAMIATVRDFDGRGPATSLRQRALDALGLDDIQQILFRVDAQGMTRREKASLASLVIDAAAEGDRVATGIIERGADELALMVATVAEKLGFGRSGDAIPVAIVGGLANAGEVFTAPVRTAIGRRCRGCRIVEAALPPALGAALLALEILGITADASVIRRLRESARRPEDKGRDGE
jgi:N-acetylglucosamine kinase-like BadF-type ATPase